MYSARHHFHTKQYDLERDDIWLQETGGKRRRLLQGEKFTRGNTPFSYIIDSFRWSPNGRLILAQLITTSVVDEHGTTQDSIMTLALEDNGKEVHLTATDNGRRVHVCPGAHVDVLRRATATADRCRPRETAWRPGRRAATARRLR